jgi:hypothetical protein
MPCFELIQTKPTIFVLRTPQHIVSVKAMLVRRDNRHEAENAKFLRERTSDPLGPESCAVTARDTVKRRQGYRRGGQLSCENLQPGRPLGFTELFPECHFLRLDTVPGEVRS